MENYVAERNWDNLEVFETVRRNTDDIRERQILELLESPVRSREAFYAIHRAECSGNKEAALTFIPQVVPEECNDFIRADVKNFHPGVRRTKALNTWHARHLAPEHLEEIEGLIMDSLDKMTVVDEADFLRKATMIMAALMLAHLPEDISGRTTEDFLVYLSRKHGYPLTISTNGYRGYPFGADDPVEQVGEVQDELFADLLFVCDKGLKKPRFKSREEIVTNGILHSFIWYKWLRDRERKGQNSWQMPLVDELSRRFGDSIFQATREFSTAILFEDSIEPLMLQYPALGELQGILTLGRQQVYRVLDQDVGRTADRILDGLAFTPIAASHWHPDHVPAFGQLVAQLRSGIEYLTEKGEKVLAGQIRARANKVLGYKAAF